MMAYRHSFWLCLFGAAAVWATAPAAAQGVGSARQLADRAQALEAQGTHDQALALYTQAIELHALPAAEQARLLFDRGLILDAQDRLADALGDYSAAIALAPRFAPALNNRANVYRRQSRFAEASRDYLASLTAGNPQPEYPWYGLGEVAEAQGNVAAARADYARSVAANSAYQLPADRLKALGGTPGVIADDEIIHLKPPRGVKAAAVTPSGPEPEEAAGDDAPVQLHAPRPRVAQSLIAPARYTPEASPGLRPALDNSASAKAQIQLGSWRSEAEAGEGWNKAVNAAGGLLDGLSPHIVAADLPGRGRFYRLRAGPVTGTPSQLCQALTARGLDCLPARD